MTRSALHMPWVPAFAGMTPGMVPRPRLTPTLLITSLSVVMAGPDPAIHSMLRDRMDPRVRPGDDMVG